MLNPEVEANINKFLSTEKKVSTFKSLLSKIQSNHIEEIDEIRIYEYLLFFMHGETTYQHSFDTWKNTSSVPYPNKEIKENDFIEDLNHENGNYQRTCIKCGINFIGHKRRVLCKICQNNIKIEGDK